MNEEEEKLLTDLAWALKSKEEDLRTRAKRRDDQGERNIILMKARELEALFELLTY